MKLHNPSVSLNRSASFSWPLKLIVIALFLIPAVLWIGIKSPLDCAIFSSIDDGLYYPKIAQNFSKTGTFTYDNVTVTNGFHPLWQLTILPIYLVFPGTDAGLKGVYLLLIAICLVNVFLYIKICEKLKVGIAGLFIGLFLLFLNFRMFTLWFCLLETSMVLLTLQILILLWLRYNLSKGAFLFGLAAGLAFLARTDNIFLITTLGFFLLIGGIKRAGFKRGIFDSLKYAAGIAILAFPYLTINLIYFGRILPVSGFRKIKIEGNLLTKIPEVLGEFIWFWTKRVADYLGVPSNIIYIIMSVIAAGTAIAIVILLKRDKLDTLKSAFKRLAPFATAIILHYAFISTFMQFEAVYSFWYLVSEITVLTLLSISFLTDAIDLFNSNLKKGLDLAAVAIVIMLLFGELMLYPRYYRQHRFEAFDLIEFIRENTDPDDLFTCYDSGRMSYFGERNFIAENGLIGDFELVEIVNSEGRMEKLIERYGIDWIVYIISEERFQRFSDRFVYSSGPMRSLYVRDTRLVMLRSEDFDPEMTD